MRSKGIASKIRKRGKNKSSVEFTRILSLAIDVATQRRPLPLVAEAGV